MKRQMRLQSSQPQSRSINITRSIRQIQGQRQKQTVNDPRTVNRRMLVVRPAGRMFGYIQRK